MCSKKLLINLLQTVILKLVSVNVQTSSKRSSLLFQSDISSHINFNYVKIRVPSFVQQQRCVFIQENAVYFCDPADIQLLKVNNRNTRTRCEIFSKLTVKAPERRHWCRSGVFIVNFELISHLVLVFLLLTLPSGVDFPNSSLGMTLPKNLSLILYLKAKHKVHKVSALVY